MSKKIENQLMQDPDVIALLKFAIAEKAERHSFLLKVIAECSDSKIDQILFGPITEANLGVVIQRYEADEEIKGVERDLARMCYALNSNGCDDKRITDWARAYEYATKHARIEAVVQLLTGEENFNRNIKCCFHEDRSPSLKIYVKTNRFVCFGCSARGSPIDFVMKYKNCSFKEAVLYLSNL